MGHIGPIFGIRPVGHSSNCQSTEKLINQKLGYFLTGLVRGIEH